MGDIIESFLNKRVVALMIPLVFYILSDLISVYLVPAMPFVKRIVGEFAWLDTGIITKLLFAFFTLLYIQALGNGEFARFGFTTTNFRYAWHSTWVAFTVSTGFFILFLVVSVVLQSAGVDTGSSTSNGSNGPVSHDFLFIVMKIVILTSICEELLYRGMLQSEMQRVIPSTTFLHMKVAVMIPALLFGLGHLCLFGKVGWLELVYIISSASLLGYIAGHYRDISGSLIPAIIVHMVFNLTSMGIGTILRNLQ